MPLDDRDPHYALGKEHGHEERERYTFQDCEHQRRYLIGYEAGLCERRMVSRDARAESLAAFEQLSDQMARKQQPSRFLQSVWAQSPVWPTIRKP